VNLLLDQMLVSFSIFSFASLTFFVSFSSFFVVKVLLLVCFCKNSSRLRIVRLKVCRPKIEGHESVELYQ